MELFLGIDGGQSSTTVLIGDRDGQVIGWSSGGPCNHVGASESVDKFTSVIRTCLSEACLIAGLRADTVRFASACCGMSGGPNDKAKLLSQILTADQLSVETDGEVALFGAMSGGPGIIVISGTGSIAYGRSARGDVKRAGGWGYMFGDEGSAFDIVKQAVRASLRYEEGWGGRTLLHSALLGASGARDANHMLHLLYTSAWPRARVAALAKLVDDISREGDAIAHAILEQAGQSLASLAGSILGQLFEETHSVRIAPVGGVFRSQTVHGRFKMLIELRDGSSCVAADLEPSAGALLYAYRSAGRKVMLRNIPDLK